MTVAKNESWSYSTGEKGKNRVRVYEKGAAIFIETFERDGPANDWKRRRVSLGRCDHEDAKVVADETAARIRRHEAPRASTLTLAALFDNWYLKEITPAKSTGKQRHDRTCAEMFCRCFGGKRHPKTLNVRDWQKFIRERRAGTLRPLSMDEGDGEKKPIRAVSDLQLRYDLKFLMAVLNFATMARDDSDVPLLLNNPLKGLPYPADDTPRRPLLTDDSYQRMRKVASRVHPRFRTFLELLHETGHRAASVRTLRWSDVDLTKKAVSWKPEHDKIAFAHETPLTEAAVAVLMAERARQGTIGDAWVFPSDRDSTQPLPRHTANKWWRRAEKLAEIEHVRGTGYHSSRRKFASELKGTNLRDLAYMGGWKNPETVLTVYQQPEMEVQRDALEGRKKLAVSG
jgi:integrase